MPVDDASGIDFLWIDTEHAPVPPEGTGVVPVLARLQGCAPMVCVARLDSSLIKKPLDQGASIIMVPQVNNAEEARAAVPYRKYPPEGTRGVSPGWTFYMGVSWNDYLPAGQSRGLCRRAGAGGEGTDRVERGTMRYDPLYLLRISLAAKAAAASPSSDPTAPR